MPDQIEYREAKPSDSAAIREIPNSFTTNSIYTLNPLTSSGSYSSRTFGFTLTETPISPPLTKHFPEEDDDSSGEDEEEDKGNTTSKKKYTYNLLALTPSPTNSIIGTISTTHSRWNKRLIIANIAIRPSNRGQGIGKTLMAKAEEHALRELGGEEVKYLWLEVSNVNVPAIRSYEGMGFEVCGGDRSLYEGTEARGEVAVFMWRRCG
ncbi:hypothetical protein FQN54_006555 [Arachnomyces sp. PD_36]|nr:hypothetical protein FQN54_006555 [Arachnomyces sp. PD_36]